MNKIDLIFEKEPPENQSQDKFQVDLLLPFKTSKQKDEFISNYKSRSSRKSQQNIQRSQNRLNHQSYHKQYTKHNHQQQQKISGKKYQTVQLHNFEEHEHSIGESIQPDEAQISYDFTNDNQSSMRRKTISLKDISTIIKNKLKNAVDEIKLSKKGKRNNRTNSFQKHDESGENENEQKSKGSFNLNKVEMQEQNQQNNGMFLSELDDQRKIRNHQQVSVQNRNGSQYQSTQQHNNNNKNNHNNSSHQSRNSSKSSEIGNQMLIEEIEDYKKNQSQNGHSGHSLNSWHQKNSSKQKSNLQQKKYSPTFNHRQNSSSKNNKSHSQNQKPNLDNFKSQTKQKKLNSNGANNIKIQRKFNTKNQQIENEKKFNQKLIDKYGSKKINSSDTRQRYSQFLKKNHRDFERIYQTIRKQIRRNQTQLMKIRKQDPILILEENLNEAYSEEDKIFKQQIIKDYQKHIIAENQNMSSEDLVRYFRYLLQNAKTLYIKHIRKGK